MHHFYYMKRLGTGSFGEVFTVRYLVITPSAVFTVRKKDSNLVVLAYQLTSSLLAYQLASVLAC